MVRLRYFLPLALSATCYATTTITVPVATVVGQNPRGAQLFITLQGCQSPRVVGSAYLPLYPTPLDASSGLVTTTVYDNSQILCTQSDGMQAKTSYYSFSVLYQGQSTQMGAFQLAAGSFNLTTLTPCVGGKCILPIPPTGDTTYLRLDGANSGSLAGMFTLPAKTIYVSKLLCSYQDVNLNTGLRFDGGVAHDDTSCINAALAQATASSPIVLIQDGASLSSGIHGPAGGNWAIVGLGGGITDNGTLYGTGFYQKTGSNDDVVYNGTKGAGCVTGSDGNKYSDPGWPNATPGQAPARGANVFWKDFVINGNRGNGTNGNSTSGQPQGIGTFINLYQGSYCSYMGLNAMNLDNVEVSGVTVYNTSAYNLRLMNVGHVRVHDNTFSQIARNASPATYGQNGDSIHVSGKAEDLTFSDNYCRATDDCIALNAPEGWPGEIRGVRASNIVSDYSVNVFRAYTGSIAPPAGDETPHIFDVQLTNVGGTATQAGALLGLFSTPTRSLTISDSIDNVTWSNSYIAAPYGFLQDDSIGILTLDNITLDFLQATNGQPGFWQPDQNNENVSALAIRNSRVVRRSGFAAFTGVVDSATGIFGRAAGTFHAKNLNIGGFMVEDVAATALTNVPGLVNLSPSSTVDLLHVGEVSWGHIVGLQAGNPGSRGTLSFVDGNDIRNSGLTCGVYFRGVTDYVEGAAGAADSMRVCAKDSSGTYAWRTIY